MSVEQLRREFWFGAILPWADQQGIPLRGHCVFWDVSKYVQPWLKDLSDDEMRRAMEERGRSIGARYRGRVRRV